jgi:hypothetical protein
MIRFTTRTHTDYSALNMKALNAQLIFCVASIKLRAVMGQPGVNLNCCQQAKTLIHPTVMNAVWGMKSEPILRSSGSAAGAAISLGPDPTPESFST